jgi:hypothetical protein
VSISHCPDDEGIWSIGGMTNDKATQGSARRKPCPSAKLSTTHANPLTRIEPRLPGLETGEKSSDISRPGEDISQSGAA